MNIGYKIEKVLLAASVMIMVALGYSCSAEMNEAMGDIMGPPPTNYYIAFGSINPALNTFTDDSGVVWQIVEKSELAEQYVMNGEERVLVCYSPVDWSMPSLRVNDITEVVTKDICRLDEMTDSQVEALGTSHLTPCNVSVSGGYINLSCYTHEAHSVKEAEEHYNLVFDTANSTADTALFMLRSNRTSLTECGGEGHNLLWLSFAMPDNFGELYPQHPLYMFNWYPCAVGSSELAYGKLNVAPSDDVWTHGRE